MTEYFNDVEGKKFTDLVDNPDFQRDLVRFFSGPRYGMTPEEIQEEGPSGLARKFVRHMRWQSVNEYTALSDLNLVRNREQVGERDLEAFGGLIAAFDRSEGGGTGFMPAAWDYVSAFASSPTTIATVATAGWGIKGKLAARAAGKSAQGLMRSQVSDLVHRRVANDVIKDTVAGTVRQGAIRGGVASAAVEGSIGGAMGYMRGEIREETTGEEYGASDVLADAAISATFGGALGSASRALSVRDQRKVVEAFANRDSAAMQALEQARKATADRLASAPSDVSGIAADRAAEVANILSARETGTTRLDPLNPEFVQRGDEIKAAIFSGASGYQDFTASLSVDTLRGVTAATVDIVEQLNIGPSERITSAVSRAITEGRLDPAMLNRIRDNYGLSAEEMSLVYLADLSQAGRTLAEASVIKRSAARAGTTEAAQRELAETANDIGRLYDQGLSTINDKVASQVVAEIYKPSNIVGKGWGALQEADSLRIAFMTSQVGTTMANNVTSTGKILLDISDQFWKSFANATYGREVAGQTQRNWTGGVFSTLRGMTLDKADAKIARGLFEESFPLEYRRTFFEITRAEGAVEGMTKAAKIGRFVNTFNSASDSVFKQATFYSGLDRRLREFGTEATGRNFSEFLSTGQSLDRLPRDIVNGAIDDARRYTFQRSYQGDPSVFGTVAASVETAHRKVPFLVSAGLGIPFPRYIANHMEHINDYTAIGLVTGGLNRLDNQLFGDAVKTGQDRFARQMTGASLVMLGYYTSSLHEGEVPYNAILTETGELDVTRTSGPFIANFFIGDLLYRYNNDLPFPDKLGREVREIAGGLGDLGLNTNFLEAINESVSQGQFTEELRLQLGDVAATFTYPLTVFRDVQGMLEPAAAGTPYTRPVFAGPIDEPSMYGATGNYLDDITARATRFLPDYNFVQYSQTFNGSNDIPYYSIFDETPVGSFNPLSRQFGFRSTPRPNEIRREMSSLNLRDFDLYSRRNIPNASVAWAVEKNLSSELNDRFKLWSSEVQQQGSFAGQTYNEIEDVEQKKILFRNFVSNEIKREVDMVEQAFEGFLAQSPRAAAGYIRNMYVTEEARLSRNFGGNVYDTSVAQFTEGRFKSAAEFLMESETIEDEVLRRQQIMNWANIMTSSTTQLGDRR